MTQTVLLMDIGGSNTRAKIIGPDQEVFADVPPKVTRAAKISTRTDLLDFINTLLSDYELKDRLSLAVLCFAGPVTNHSRVTLTNWAGTRDIAFNDLVQCGLPTEATFLVNDMEAAAWSLLNSQHDDDAVNPHILPLYTVTNMGPTDNNNMVLLMPGTGMGVASIVASTVHGQSNPSLIIPAEVQHSAIPALDAEHTVLIKEFSRHLQKDHICWEDFISGSALENIYSALADTQSTTGRSDQWDEKMSTDEIAALAVSNADALCRSALNLYYRCAGALAQVLALTLQPFAGIYLMGRTTEKNLSFIPQSGFLEELQRNEKQAELLKKFPVYLVTEDLNLDGAACIARQHLQVTTQIPLFAQETV